MGLRDFGNREKSFFLVHQTMQTVVNVIEEFQGIECLLVFLIGFHTMYEVKVLLRIEQTTQSVVNVIQEFQGIFLNIFSYG